MRTTRVLEMLLCLQGLKVVDVTMLPSSREVVVDVETKKRRHFCPSCAFTTRARYDQSPAARRWRHINLGVFRVWLQMRLSRLECPRHGVITEAVPWAEHGSYFTVATAPDRVHFHRRHRDPPGPTRTRRRGLRKVAARRRVA